MSCAVRWNTKFLWAICSPVCLSFSLREPWGFALRQTVNGFRLHALLLFSDISHIKHHTFSHIHTHLHKHSHALIVEPGQISCLRIWCPWMHKALAVESAHSHLKVRREGLRTHTHTLSLYSSPSRTLPRSLVCLG